MLYYTYTINESLQLTDLLPKPDLLADFCAHENATN